MKNEVKFEEAMEKLEYAVSVLESGKLPLDRAISVYEEAVSLIKVCHARLEDAKQKVRLLTETADGSVTDVDFVTTDET